MDAFDEGQVRGWEAGWVWEVEDTEGKGISCLIILK